MSNPLGLELQVDVCSLAGQALRDLIQAWFMVFSLVAFLGAFFFFLLEAESHVSQAGLKRTV